MKKCDRFKDLILTDYIDGELDKDSSQRLESHLLGCSDCRSFLKEVKEGAALPFQKVSRQPVPAQLWDTIRQNIEHEGQAASPVEDIVDKLKGLFSFPRMVPIFASLVVMVLVGSVTVNTIQVQQAKAKDQGEYLVSLLSPSGPAGAADNNESETPIEHYFL